jgi:predicted permease
VTWWSRFRRRGTLERQLDAELRYHVDRLTQDFMAEGLPEAEARRRARLEFGGLDQVKEDCRDARGTRWAHDALQDLTFSVRLLAKDRLFTAAAVLALGLGIGVNNMLFTIVDALCIRGLSIPRVDRMVYIESREAGRSRGLSFPEFDEIRSGAQSLDETSAFITLQATLAETDRAPDRVALSYVSEGFFHLTGAAPILGRDFRPDDDRAGALPVAVLDGRLWNTRYGSDPAVLGRVVTLNGLPATLIGVMPDGYRLPGNTDAWLTLTQTPAAVRNGKDARSLGVMGTMKDGRTVPHVAEEMAALGARLAQRSPDTNHAVQLTAVPLNERFNGRITDPAWLAFISVGILIVVIACSNVANLLLARSVYRSREIAIRVSMGATRWRVVRQLLVEGTMLAAIGGLLGLGLSYVGLRIFTSAIPATGLPFWVHLTMDGRAFGELAAVCLGTVLLFALAPAMQVARADVNDVLKEAGRASAGGPRARRWTATLLAAQFGITVILLASLGLSLRQFRAAERAEVVVAAPQLLTMSVALPGEKYVTADQRLALYSALRERLSGVETISETTVASALPFATRSSRRVVFESRTTPGDAPPNVVTVSIDARYFDAVGVPLYHGRSFVDLDGAPGHESAIVNQRFASLYFPGADPLGRRVAFVPEAKGSPPVWLTIVGVAPTIPQRSGPVPDPVVYVPIRSEPPLTFSLIVRTKADPGTLTAVLREQVRSLDPDVPLFQVMTLARVEHDSGWNARVSNGLITTIASIALLLSAIGLLAMTTHAVAQRRHELGIRIALGARRGTIMAIVLRGAMFHVAVGLGVGIVCTAVWERLFRTPGMLTSPMNLLMVSAVMALMGAAASLWPAHRATRVDPLAALRQQ